MKKTIALILVCLIFLCSLIVLVINNKKVNNTNNTNNTNNIVDDLDVEMAPLETEEKDPNIIIINSDQEDSYFKFYKMEINLETKKLNLYFERKTQNNPYMNLELNISSYDQRLETISVDLTDKNDVIEISYKNDLSKAVSFFLESNAVRFSTGGE